MRAAAALRLTVASWALEMLPAFRLLAAKPGAALILPKVFRGNFPPGKANLPLGALRLVAIYRTILVMDDLPKYTSLTQFLQEQQKIVEDLCSTYSRIIGDLSRFMQEIPADLLLQADYLEQNPPVDMEDAEVRAYANGVRYAAVIIVTAINAKMMMEQAELKGEFDALKEVEGDD